MKKRLSLSVALAAAILLLALAHPMAAPAAQGGRGSGSRVALGGGHTLAIKSDGSLWAWGINNWGQLGIGDVPGPTTPVRVGTDYDWAQVAAGFMHSVALKADGSLWTWGRNDDGELGNGGLAAEATPARVGSDTTWVAVAAGHYHTLAIKSDGSLWAWGYNAWGQLGDNSTDRRLSPVMVGSDSNWVAVAGGGEHSLALKGDGSLWGWGRNWDGQLGDGTTVNQSSPARVYLPPKRATTLALSGTKISAAYGSLARLSGTMMSGGVTTPLTVTVWSRAASAGAPWTPTGSALWNNITQNYEASRPVYAKTYFQMRFTGDETYLPSTSPETVFTSRAYMSTPTLSTSRPLRNRYFTVSGLLKPQHAGYTYLQFYYKSGARWVKYGGLIKLRHANAVGGYGKYTLRYRLRYARRWMVKAKHLDADHLESWSAGREFTTR